MEARGSPIIVYFLSCRKAKVVGSSPMFLGKLLVFFFSDFFGEKISWVLSGGVLFCLFFVEGFLFFV